MKKSLINTITTKLDLENDISKLSIVDNIKIELNKDILYKILNEYTNTNTNPNDIEKYIIKLVTSKEEKIISILANNYYENLFLSIYFIIGNPFSIDTQQFDILYDNYNIINEIIVYIINQYNIIINKPKLASFYNIDFINKWIETIILKPVKKQVYFNISKLNIKMKNEKWDKYKVIWKEFNKNCHLFKKYLFNVAKFYSLLPYNKVVGCSNISKKLYLHCISMNISLDIKSKDIKKLEKWAFRELSFLQNKMKKYLEIITKNNKITSSNIIKNLKLLSKTQKFTSEKEYIDIYIKCIDKYEKLFIDKYKLPQYIKPTLVPFNNSKLGHAYYNDNNFYLNCYYWNKTYKYTVESLVLHETIPGHHTQLHVGKYINENPSKGKKNNYLLYSYFFTFVNSIAEGWGLWSEKLGIDQTIWDKIGQVEFETFRTLRIIVDINLHYNGYTPDEMILFMSKYLAMDKQEITNEVYRYICEPGQALSYKIGSTFFKKIIEKNNITDLLEEKAIILYKKIILDGIKPLNVLMKEYNITIDELFS